MIRTAVIGANGFLGRNLVTELKATGHHVTCVYHKALANLVADSCQKIGDFINSKTEYDNIVFSAGSHLNSHKDLIYLNCTLINELAKHHANARLLYVSSVNVYGIHAGVIHEDSSFNTPLLYGQSKLAGEFIAASWKSFAIVRLTYLYGPNLNNSSFLPLIISQAKNLNKIKLMGTGGRCQDYLFAEDAAKLCVKALAKCDNGIYLGATGKSYSNLHLAEIVASKFPGCEISFTGEEQGISFYFDPTQTMELLDWAPLVDIEEGLIRSI